MLLKSAYLLMVLVLIGFIQCQNAALATSGQSQAALTLVVPPQPVSANEGGIVDCAYHEGEALSLQSSFYNPYDPNMRLVGVFTL